MNSEYSNKDIQELIHAVLTLKSEKEAADFFRDLLTVKEIQEFSNRWQMVKMIDKGTPYLEIAQKLGVSTTTVSRCAHWLHHGTGGYRTALSRISKK